jgi:S-adenosylmethionine decarboxylase proenzyme
MGEEKVCAALGNHILLEFHGCSTNLKDSAKVKEILLKAAKVSQAHIVDSFFHQFSPHGVSGVIVISESHYAIHTWPEHEYAAIDLFSCSEDLRTEEAIKFLKEAFQPEAVSMLRLDRGSLTA